MILSNCGAVQRAEATMFAKKRVRAPATILADEGYGLASNSQRFALQHEKYIVEVHPETEPAFRVELKAWVSWPDKPEEGDEVQVLYEPGTHDVELDLDGDPRFDWKLRASKQQADDAAKREALLRAPVSQDSSGGNVDAGASFADLLARHQRGELTDDEFRTEEAKLFGG
jgi:hypothetical protein